MYERFTDRARKVYQLAQQEAHRFNHDKVDVFHILIALVKEGSGVAAHVLKNLDVDLRRIRLEVEKHVITGYIGEVVKGKLPYTEAANAIAPLAVNEAAALGHNYVGTEHLLLGIVREEFTGMPGIAGKVLLGLGLDAKKIRNEIMEIISNFDGPIKPGSYRFLVNDATSPTVYTKPNQCCFIDRKTNEQCGKQAEFWIGTDGVDNYTHSCEEHVKDLRQDGDVVRAFASSGPASPAEASRNVRAQTSAWSILRNDPMFAAIMQETEYEFAERWKDLVKKDVSRSDIHRVERDMLTKFVEMLASCGYTITRTPVYDAQGTKMIGVDMAAGRDFTGNRWVYGEAKPHPMAAIELVEQTMGVCKPPQGSLSAVTDWARTSVGLGSDVGDTKEAIRKEMISTVVENVKHFKHALTVEELIDAPKTVAERIVDRLEDFTQRLESGECICKSLLNGHENGCPLASK